LDSETLSMMIELIRRNCWIE